MIMASDASLSIILPACNEAESLRQILPDLIQRFPEAELLVINDGSTDDTEGVCNQFDCRMINQPYNMGNGAAVKRGAREAKGELLAFMDADSQHKGQELEKLICKIQTDDYDMVVGSRAPGAHATPWRRFANGIFNKLASWMTNHPVLDLTSGMRVARASRFKEFLHLLPNGFSYPTTITMAFFRSGYSVCYEPIDVHERKGTSHIRPLRDGIRFLLIIFKIGSMYSPLKLFLPISLLLFLTASGLYLYTYLSVGRFTNMSALLYSTSLLVFLIGMVSEQITNLLFSKRKY